MHQQRHNHVFVRKLCQDGRFIFSCILALMLFVEFYQRKLIVYMFYIHGAKFQGAT